MILAVREFHSGILQFHSYEETHKAAIRAVLADAFPSADEADLVERLRADGDAIIELVAVLQGEEPQGKGIEGKGIEGKGSEGKEPEGKVPEGEVLGQVMLSAMRMPDKTLGLAPIGVRQDVQNQKIGAHLMEVAIDRAKADGWKAIFLLGNPAYYGRFGFSVAAAAEFVTPYPQEYFQVLELEDGFLQHCPKQTAYAKAFGA